MKVPSLFRFYAWSVLIGTLLSFVACAKQPEVITLTGQGQRASIHDIDQEPWALVPGGAIAWMQLELPALLKAPYGPAVVRLLEERLPRPAGLSLSRDIDSFSGAGYATVSLDWVLIARGKFDRKKFAAASPAQTLSGQTIVQRQYAGERIWSAGQLSLCALSSKTLVLGSETAVRRVIERVVEGRLARATPAWLDDLLQKKAQPLTLGIDLDSNPIPAVLKTEFSLLKGMRAGRVIGNFSEPGLNLTGALNYSKPSQAKEAAEYVKAQESQLRRYALLLRMMQLPQPIQHLQAEATDRHVQLGVELKGSALELLLQRFNAETNAYLDQMFKTDKN